MNRDSAATVPPSAATAPPGPPQDTWEAVVDPLGEALHFLRMSGVVTARSELTGPWSVDLPAMDDCVLYHVITHGECWIDVPDAEPMLLRPGEFTLVPHGQGHRIADRREALEPEADDAVDFFDLPIERITPRYERLRYGGDGARTNLICGAVRFDHPAAQELVQMLPNVIRTSAWEGGEAEWMQSTLRLMAAESAALRPGGETVITRLADILVIQAIRAWIANNPAAQTGWLGALHDDRIGPAVLLIQKHPEKPWTVESLAHRVAMSRSAFAARFRELVGETPVQYLTRWRMHTALTWLTEGEFTVAELAGKLGYNSEAAFSRAFKRVIGSAPAHARSAAREAAMMS